MTTNLATALAHGRPWKYQLAFCQIALPLVMTPPVKKKVPTGEEVELTRLALERAHKEFDARPINIQKIVMVVCDFYGVTAIDIKSSRRTANVVRPRQAVMYLARTLTTKSLPQIARQIGDRDHTTVLHAVRKMGALFETDPEFREQMLRIIARLSPQHDPNQIELPFSQAAE